MARAITPTPILEGRDKEKFLEELSKLRYSSEKEKFLNECKSILKKVNIDV